MMAKAKKPPIRKTTTLARNKIDVQDRPVPPAALEVRARLVNWIKDALERKPEKKRSGLAAALRVQRPIVSRMLSGGRSFQFEEVSIISAYFEEKPPIEVFGDVFSIGSVPMAKVVGEACLDIWREHPCPALTAEPVPYVPIPETAALPHYALRVADHSADRLAPIGFYVVYVPFNDARAALRQGDPIVAVQRQGRLVRHTVRRAELVGERWNLVAPSSDQSIAPIVLDKAQKHDQNGDSVEIEGLVVWVGGVPSTTRDAGPSSPIILGRARGQRHA